MNSMTLPRSWLQGRLCSQGPDYRADDVLKVLTTGQMMFSGTNYRADDVLMDQLQGRWCSQWPTIHLTTGQMMFSRSWLQGRWCSQDPDYRADDVLRDQQSLSSQFQRDKVAYIGKKNYLSFLNLNKGR